MASLRHHLAKIRHVWLKRPLPKQDVIIQHVQYLAADCAKLPFCQFANCLIHITRQFESYAGMVCRFRPAAAPLFGHQNAPFMFVARFKCRHANQWSSESVFKKPIFFAFPRLARFLQYDIRRHHVLDVTTTYVVLTIVKFTTPLFIALAGKNRGDARGGMARETGKRRPLSC